MRILWRREWVGKSQRRMEWSPEPERSLFSSSVSGMMKQRLFTEDVWPWRTVGVVVERILSGAGGSEVDGAGGRRVQSRILVSRPPVARTSELNVRLGMEDWCADVRRCRIAPVEKRHTRMFPSASAEIMMSFSGWASK
jgi:hypothetical protein